MKHYIQYILVLLLFISCGQRSKQHFDNTKSESYSPEVEEVEEVVQTSSVKNVAINKKNIPANRKIIWTADLEVQVEDLDKSQQTISELVTKNGGFISNMKHANESYQMYNHLTIRISSDKFNSLLNQIESNGLYTRKMEVQSNDVTEEFIDINSRLKTKEEVRKRYINILQTRAGKISEVLEAEEAIRVITEEIEAQKGRLRYLKDQVSLSTINVMLYQLFEKPKSNYIAPTYWSKVKKGFINGWEGITDLLLLLINIWPFVLFVCLIIWKRKWFVKKIRSKK